MEAASWQAGILRGQKGNLLNGNRSGHIPNGNGKKTRSPACRADVVLSSFPRYIPETIWIIQVKRPSFIAHLEALNIKEGSRRGVYSQSDMPAVDFSHIDRKMQFHLIWHWIQKHFATGTEQRFRMLGL